MESWPPQSAIISWAYDPTAVDEPEQDWDRLVSFPENADLILRLATDPACPNGDFFLNCLYILAGLAVKSSGEFMPMSDLEVLFHRADQSGDPHLSRWAERSRALIKNPLSLEDRFWLDGGWALKDVGFDTSGVQVDD